LTIINNYKRVNLKVNHKISLVVFLFFLLFKVEASVYIPSVYIDSPEVVLPFPIEEHTDPTDYTPQSFDLGIPSNVTTTIEYDPVSGRYIFKEKIGENTNLRNPSMMTLEEYLKQQQEKEMQDYWKERIEQDSEDAQFVVPPIVIEGDAFRNIFGSDEINIRPQGSVELSFGVNSSRYDNPILPENQRKITRFDFNQRIQLNLVGQIGTRLKLSTSYNTEAAFDFENITKLEYTGDEDQIIQKIEAGNVSLPLNTSLIQGASALFGVKTQMRFGRLTIDAIASQSRGQKQEINVSGGAQVQRFDVGADNYEANRHYFINHYFHDHYNEAMAELPIVNTPINITRMEVWVTNRQNITENTRNIIAFADLGEAKAENLEGGATVNSGSEMPRNGANNLYEWAVNQPAVRSFSNSIIPLSNQIVSPGPFQQAFHYEKVENARRLTEQEFTYNALLGYVSLNMPLNTDEVLGVAYEYTVRGQTYQVGEFSTDGIEGQDALYLKMLKSTILSPKMKIWDLMMKNVYSIGAYQLSQADFRMDMWYNNPETSLPVNFMPYPGVDETLLVQLLEMDKLNQNNQPFPDGVFDFAALTQTGNKFMNGGTINPKNGRIYFSTVEPFGKTLYDKLVEAGIAPNQAQRIAFTELYDSTLIAAQMIPSKNRFSFKGEYKSSVSSDIPLNALNVPEGAVTVTAGGMRLQEGTDFVVDYNLGRVKILNSSILESNTPIKVSIESNSIFGFQQKNLLGTHFNYRVNKDFNIGATWLNMKEKPLTQKVNIGDEPYSNHMMGINMNYRSNVPLLTKLVDLLPVISTSAPSTITFRGEGAYLIPGTPRGIGKGGVSYVDDFEGSQSLIDIRTQAMWKLSSIPQGQPDLFPEGNLKNDLSAGYKRSLLAWYTIDPVFYQNGALTPKHIQEDPSMLDDARMRLVLQTELFPNLQLQQFTFQNLPVLDLAYYPQDRGMYNYDTTLNVTADGKFTDPHTRWGGIMRSLSTTNFEQANIEFIQFWMLDPFNEDMENENPNTLHSGGDLYFNLGNISEDILPDSRKSFENGLPANITDLAGVDTTVWGRVSTQQTVVNAFDNDLTARQNQDVGLDGWGNADERKFYEGYVNWVQSNGVLSADAKAKMLADPSSDDFTYYQDDNYDTGKLNILERYKRFNGHEGNSPTAEMSANMNARGYPTQATNAPDIEDINMDNNLSESESYFQYKVSLRPSDMVVGKNYITSVTHVTPPSGKVEKWYQFRVPITEPEKAINGITDFRSIRFMRMFLKNWDEEVVLRFGKLELVRGEWRRYQQTLLEPGDVVQGDPNSTTFNINVVNIEEHDQREPIKYEIPPGIQREIDPGQVQMRQMNEQSMTYQICNLMDGDARAGFRNVTFNLNNYKKLKMFVHGEEADPAHPLEDDDLTVFIRLGTDLDDNYYEYELPLKLTPWGSTSADIIWPEQNNVEIVFEDLTKLKKSRNDLLMAENPTVLMTAPYSQPVPGDPTKRITVKGSPNLQDLRSIMIGVRNPRMNSDHPWKPDDGLPKCVEVWVNELRLTDFVSEGGGAATASLQVQLADFANVSMSGNYTGLNWGSIDSRVQNRQRNVQMGFDMNTNMQLGQFFGKKARVSMPFFYSYARGVINPEFDPFNPDVKLSEYDLNERLERSRLGQDLTERKSYNFTNVRKERKPGATPHFWDIANMSLTYGYNEDLHRDFNLEYDRTKVWRGGLNYNFNANPYLFEPFKKVKVFQKSKWFTLIKEAGIYLGPKSVTINNSMLRSYNERKVRNNLSTFNFQPVYIKNFTWNRMYSVKYDITKNLKFDFTSANQAIFIEPDGQVDRKENPELYQVFKDTILRQFAFGGTTMGYNHGYNLAYNVPFNKIPALDWVTTNIRYSGGYDWQRAPLGQADFGNVIQNNRNLNLTAQMNMVNLYNKSPFLKRINSSGKPGAPQGGRGSAVNRGKLAPAKATGYLGWRIGRLKKKIKKETEEIKVLEPYRKPVQELLDSLTQAELDKQQELLASRETKKESLETKLEKKQTKAEEREKKKNEPVHPIAGFGGRMLMTVRNVSGTYSINDGTLLPGYNQGTSILGLNGSFSAPTTGFVMGQQQRDLWGRDRGLNFNELASDNDWLVRNERLNTQYALTHNQTMTARATLEPIKDLRVDLTVNRTASENNSAFFRWNDSLPVPDFELQSQFKTANLTYSAITIGSAFTAMSGRYQSQTFENMLDMRQDVSNLLALNNTNTAQNPTGYADGYSGSQQEVVMGAFLAAYTGTGVSDKSTNVFKNVPLPNWTITYDGVSKFEFMKKYVRNFVIKHSYSSTVTMSGMQTNLNYTTDNSARDLTDNFIAELQVQNVSISERFSPLIGFDATWLINKNGLITKFEYKRDRSVGLSLANNQITEIFGAEWVFGTGYKFAKVKLPWFKMNNQSIVSDLNFRFDLTVRDNVTVIRKIVENTNQATAGQNVLSIRSSLDYNVGRNLTAQIYYDQMITNPKIATSYPTGNMNCGIRLRINLGGL
jgi:cell surface protein SprA